MNVEGPYVHLDTFLPIQAASWGWARWVSEQGLVSAHGHWRGGETLHFRGVMDKRPGCPCPERHAGCDAFQLGQIRKQQIQGDFFFKTVCVQNALHSRELKK